MPPPANWRRHCPARIASDGPNGAHRKPRTSRPATPSSPGSRPRHISSIEIAQVHGSSPWRRRARRRSPAGRPRRASMRTVESSRILAISADATPVGALVTDPFTGIGIPFVALVSDGPERCLDIVPSPLVFKSSPDQLRDECAASPAAGAPIEFGDKLVVDCYVQSHVPMIAHCAPPRCAKPLTMVALASRGSRRRNTEAPPGPAEHPPAGLCG